MRFTPTVKLGYTNLWAKAKVLPGYEVALKSICTRKFIANRARYEAVEKLTGVPWWWIAIVHERESGCNFFTHLANGDPLDKPTTHVPAGRGPFDTWEDGAVDALRYMGLDQITDWSLPHALYQFERYNGWGYLGRCNSPYVWSWTDLYTGGKFISDGVFSASAVDNQPGCAAMLQILLALVPGLLTKVLTPMTQTTTTTTTPVPAPVPTVPSAGITVSTATNLATHLLFGVGVALGTFGLTSAHDLWSGVFSSGVIGGLLTSGLAWGISHLSVVGANDNTISFVDNLLKQVIAMSGQSVPNQQSLLDQVAAQNHPQA